MRDLTYYIWPINSSQRYDLSKCEYILLNSIIHFSPTADFNATSVQIDDISCHQPKILLLFRRLHIFSFRINGNAE
jgi:hypothetical protein